MMESTIIATLEEEVTQILSELRSGGVSTEDAHLHAKDLEKSNDLLQRQLLSIRGASNKTRVVVRNKSCKRKRDSPQPLLVPRRRYANKTAREELQRLAAIPNTTYCALVRATYNIPPEWACIDSNANSR